jgi:hypothetical protein
MSTQIDDGGPAFPIPYGQVMSEDGKGMTLRDWFAGQALAGLLANGGAVSWEDDATNAYTVADAMIEARKGGRL